MKMNKEQIIERTADHVKAKLFGEGTGLDFLPSEKL